MKDEHIVHFLLDLDQEPPRVTLTTSEGRKFSMSQEAFGNLIGFTPERALRWMKLDIALSEIDLAAIEAWGEGQ